MNDCSTASGSSLDSASAPLSPDSCVLDNTEMESILNSHGPRSIRAGETIFAQGETIGGMLCIVDGTVAIHRSHNKDQSSLLRLRDSGSTLGLDALFGSGVHTTSAVALTNCTVVEIEASKLCSLMSTSPELFRKLMAQLAFALQDSDEARVNAVHLQVRARLAALLLALRDRHGQVDESGNLRIKLPLSRRDMASAIGTRPESLSRAIRALENDDVAQFSGKHVLVQDLDDLLDEVESP